jgi:hypothetical protein
MARDTTYYGQQEQGGTTLSTDKSGWRQQQLPRAEATGPAEIVNADDTGLPGGAQFP